MYRIAKRRKRQSSHHEIQIAPLIDVMLVLLVVFISVAPAVIAGVDVSLPKGGDNLTEVSASEDSLTVSCLRGGKIFVNDDEVDKKYLVNYIGYKTHNNKNSTIFIKGDKGVPYGVVIELLSSINKSGYKSTVLITDPTDD